MLCFKTCGGASDYFKARAMMCVNILSSCTLALLCSIMNLLQDSLRLTFTAKALKDLLILRKPQGSCPASH